MQLLPGAFEPGRAPGAGALRSDAGHPPRPDGTRTRVARIRGVAARHRRTHQLLRASQAFLLPDQERRSARLPSRRDRSDGARRALSPPRHAEAITRRICAAALLPPAHGEDAGVDSPRRRKPRPEPCAANLRPGSPRSRRGDRHLPALGGRRRARIVGHWTPSGAVRGARRQAGEAGACLHAARRAAAFGP